MSTAPADPAAEHVRRVVTLFDELAETYDGVGVDFFRPVAARLVAMLDPQPGEHAADLGCGRGAATVPLATAVGPTGEVIATDLAPAMVEATAALVAGLGFGPVGTAVMDAARPTLPAGAFDVVVSSLVLFFLPDPAAAARAWVELLRPGGRLGVTTFGAPDGAWAAIDDVFAPHLPPAVADARASALSGPFASDEGMAALLGDAGLEEVASTHHRQRLLFDDLEHWYRWSMSTGQRSRWAAVPSQDRPAVLDAIRDVLEGTRHAGGLELSQDLRYTVGRRAG